MRRAQQTFAFGFCSVDERRWLASWLAGWLVEEGAGQQFPNEQASADGTAIGSSKGNLYVFSK